MCCVIPPASVVTTDDSRIASSRVVLPWSTWPMIVTTGGRETRSASSSSKTTSSSSSSSSVCWTMISRSSSPAISSTASSVSDTVSVTISPSPIISVMILAGEMPSFSARSLTVMPDGTLTGPVGASGSRLGSARGAPRSRRMVGLRPAWASITTRRLPLGAAPRWGRGARPGCAGRSSAGGAAFAPNARFTSSSSTNSSAISPRQPSEEVSRCAIATRSSRSGGTVTVHRSFLGIAPRLRARSTQPGSGHRYTPRPGSRRSRSTTNSP